MLCAYLAGAVLVGLVANAAVGAWWLDALVALAVAGIAVTEGRKAWRGRTMLLSIHTTQPRCGPPHAAARGRPITSRPAAGRRRRLPPTPPASAPAGFCSAGFSVWWVRSSDSASPSACCGRSRPVTGGFETLAEALR